MNRCSVLNLEMFERQVKAEGLGMGAELTMGDHQNLNDYEFTIDLFRFIQLTCEGHNLGISIKINQSLGRLPKLPPHATWSHPSGQRHQLHGGLFIEDSRIHHGLLLALQ